jgi:hypothetical protein
MAFAKFLECTNLRNLNRKMYDRNGKSIQDVKRKTKPCHFDDISYGRVRILILSLGQRFMNNWPGNFLL